LDGKYVEEYVGEYRKMCSGESAVIMKSVDVDVVAHIELRRLEWTGHTCRVDGWIKNAKGSLRRKNIW
jgi:hypothetical protein